MHALEKSFCLIGRDDWSNLFVEFKFNGNNGGGTNNKFEIFRCRRFFSAER